MEEVGAEGAANDKKELGIDGGTIEKTLKGALGDTYALHQPGISMALAAEFVADKVTYMYLHSGCY